MAKTWTIEIGALGAQPYKLIDFDRNLETKLPTEFRAKIKYNASVDFFDLVQIKRNGTVEWKGFVETIEIAWDSQGRYMDISGRDTRLILWKKYSEGFGNLHEGTKGFFGSVNANELIQLLLRTPKSDFNPDIYPNNKEGWGIDVGRMGNLTAYRTAVGDPNYCKLRRTGYGWRNSGNPFANDEDVVDAEISRVNWTAYGAPPYLDIKDDANYIKSDSIIGGSAVYSFSDLPANATSLEKVHLTVWWRADRSYWWWLRAECNIYISPDNGATWHYIGYFGEQNGGIWAANPWKDFTFDASGVINTVAKFNACQVKFVEASDQLSMNITQAYLSVGYSTGGNQSTFDYLDIPFQEETVVGIYFESRNDDDSYPRKYKIVTIGDRTAWDAVNYTEVDPANYIEFQDSDRQIYFDCRQDVDAWLYKDYGVGQIGDFDWKFSFNLTSSDPNSSHAFQPFCVCNGLMDLRSLMVPLGNGESFIVVGINNTAGTLRIRVARKDQNAGGRYDEDYSGEISLGDEYFVNVVRSGATVTFYVYTDSDMGPESLFYSHSFPIEVAETFRYREHALTYNDASNLATVGYISTGSLEETELVPEVTNSVPYRDIIHSWTPQVMDNIRIRLTDDDASHSWCVTQVYVYKAETCNYRVHLEAGGDACDPSPFPDEQYIKTVTFDSTYAPAVGPLNIPMGRLIDSINKIVEFCNLSYIPYEWWLAYDVSNTFHIKAQKGGSPAVTFAKATNLGGVVRTRDISDTVQRLKVIGQGEGQRSQKISSDWQEDTGEMATVNSWYEEVIPAKTVVDKSVADELANVLLEAEDGPVEQFTVIINNDSYASMFYDVGDDITITDSLTGASGLYRIYHIKKYIDDNGEQITLTVGSPRRDEAEAWAGIFKRLKDLELAGVVADDWSAEVEEENVAVEKVSAFFEKTAKNDESSAGSEIRDPKWHVEIDGLPPVGPVYQAPQGYDLVANPTPEEYQFANGGLWQRSDEWMAMLGPDSGSVTQSLMVEIRGELNDIVNVKMSQNPKFVAEMKIYEDSPQIWVEDDYFEIGFSSEIYNICFLFRIVALGSSLFRCDVVVNTSGTRPADDNVVTIRTLAVNTKYRFEILTKDGLDESSKMVIFSIYDLDKLDQTYPPSRIALDISPSIIVRPLWMKLVATDDGDKRAAVYIYRFRTEWEKV